jgi:hypothetical protein
MQRIRCPTARIVGTCSIARRTFFAEAPYEIQTFVQTCMRSEAATDMNSPKMAHRVGLPHSPRWPQSEGKQTRRGRNQTIANDLNLTQYRCLLHGIGMSDPKRKFDQTPVRATRESLRRRTG